MATETAATETIDRDWTFLTNHGHVLICLARDPNQRGWEIAQKVGITERAAQKIVTDLVESGYVRRERVGRRNVYTVTGDRALRHPLEAGHTANELLDTLGAPTANGSTSPTAAV